MNRTSDPPINARSISVVVRLLPRQGIVGRVDVVETGEVVAISNEHELLALLRRLTDPGASRSS